jgi:hypothetical protein
MGASDDSHAGGTVPSPLLDGLHTYPTSATLNAPSILVKRRFTRG